MRTVDGAAYNYTLILGTTGNPPKPIVKLETLICDGTQLVRFERGYVTVDQSLLDPNGLSQLSTIQGSFPLDSGRSSISGLGEVPFTDLVHRFRRWLGTVYCFRINPLKMVSRAEGEDADPKLDLSNFAAWYRSLSQSHPKRVHALFESLEETLQGFDSIVLKDAAEGVRLLNAVFQRAGSRHISFGFRELSEGQRCLICLYTILHLVVAEGRTVIIDEPENFVSLREIQPWLKAASRMVSEANGQLILISHSPELIDQWAPAHGIRFVRDGIGPAKVEPWHGDPESGLSPAQLIARGWDDA